MRVTTTTSPPTISPEQSAEGRVTSQPSAPAASWAASSAWYAALDLTHRVDVAL
jgi:hypothetical protein